MFNKLVFALAMLLLSLAPSDNNHLYETSLKNTYSFIDFNIWGIWGDTEDDDDPELGCPRKYVGCPFVIMFT